MGGLGFGVIGKRGRAPAEAMQARDEYHSVHTFSRHLCFGSSRGTSIASKFEWVGRSGQGSSKDQEMKRLRSLRAGGRPEGEHSVGISDY